MAYATGSYGDHAREHSWHADVEQQTAAQDEDPKGLADHKESHGECLPGESIYYIILSTSTVFFSQHTINGTASSYSEAKGLVSWLVVPLTLSSFVQLIPKMGIKLLRRVMLTTSESLSFAESRASVSCD